LIYREERIGRKTFERYKGREDKLIYRSVTFNPDFSERGEKDLTIFDNHYTANLGAKNKGEVVILKMTERFALNPEILAEEQIRKTEYNLVKGRVYIYKHYNSGRITTGSEVYIRDELIGGDAKVGGDIGEKDSEESQKAQTNKRILEMERRCHE